MNEHFPELCSLIQTKSIIPSVFTPLTHNLLSSFQFTADDIKSIINKLDPNKVHDHGMISILMINLCGESIYKPLEIFFKCCLNQGIFPVEWKSDNVETVHKKGDHKCVKNCRLVSPLPLFSKIFERLIHSTLLKHFFESNPISPNQSGFKPGDSCT